MKDCVFCGIVSGKIPCQKIWENDHFISFADINPLKEGHALVIPKKHFNSLIDSDKETAQEYLFSVKEVAKILMEKYKASGFNIVINNGKAAGQKVDHIHFHILPRK